MAMNRRSFIKGSSAFAFSASIMGCSNSSDDDIVEEPPVVEPPIEVPPEESIPDGVYHTTCPRNCGDRCSLMVTTKDGVAVSITGDTTHPVTAGTPCVKGHSYLQSVYSPDRIQQPMKRVGPRGPGATFEPISWEDAYAQIASRLNEIINTDGGNAIVPYSYSGYSGISAGTGANRFFNRIAGRNLQRNICASAGYSGMSSILGEFNGPSPEDYANTKCFVSWGTNEQATNIHHLKFINEARDNGAKVLVVNPARTPLASQADIWLQPTPGTDATLVVGISKIIIEENLHDTAFIAANTQDYDALVARLAEFTHEEIELETGVSKSEYQEFARAYAQADCAMIRIGYGIQRTLNGGRMVKAIPTIAALTGNIGKVGAGVVYLNVMSGGLFDWGYSGASHLTPEGAERGTVSINEIGKFLLPEDYQHENGLVGPISYGEPSDPIKAMIVYSSNPMAIAPNTDLIEKGLMRDDLFLVGIDLFQTDTMDYVDYLLPTSSYMEQSNLIDSYQCYYAKHSAKAIMQLHDSKPDTVIFNELAKAMGFDDVEFDESIDDILRNTWKGNISYDELLVQKWDSPIVDYPYRKDLVFPTTSGKIEFKDTSNKYFDSEKFNPVIDTGTPESNEYDDKGMTDAEKAREFRLLSPAHAKLSNSQWANVKYIAGTFPQHTVYVHPSDAGAKGISDGDEVIVTASRYGSADVQIQYVARVEEMTPKGTVFIWKNAWKKLNENGSNTSVNQLTNCDLTDMNYGSTFHATRVDIALA
ncbi:molybdopterin-dependent oxidoreductase [Shewanella electrodiphila]|uniref:Molybdopterin-dependent oxidoreductase n=1 Tax=Shewanella electrodiphila TaxID=934143 RepID=A0ABT0KQN8_9GAMM|nr:molybdopterin-dependent oxidoreductase [Shewanella electrodiphila]MCL1045984.1 molybdopterin-dependent oxidoreductase [Shewanella electrodiphila]